MDDRHDSALPAHRGSRLLMPMCPVWHLPYEVGDRDRRTFGRIVI